MGRQNVILQSGITDESAGSFSVSEESLKGQRGGQHLPYHPSGESLCCRGTWWVQSQGWMGGTYTIHHTSGTALKAHMLNNTNTVLALGGTCQGRLSIQTGTKTGLSWSFPQICFKVTFNKFEGPTEKYNCHNDSSHLLEECCFFNQT